MAPRGEPLREKVDHVPVLWVEPAPGLEPASGPAVVPVPARIVLWLPWLGGTKEDLLTNLRTLSDRGFVALSFDPWQHGERGTEDGGAILKRVFGNFRRHMWPILARTTEDTLRVVDWALGRFDAEPRVRMGGISMGGDISVASAAIDRRIERVAAAIATPDWLRPGADIPPGEPDAYARFLYERLDPMTHLESYSHRPAISFECGAEDAHVPPDGAIRFCEALRETYAPASGRLRLNLHEGAGHRFTREMWRNCIEWFGLEP